MCEVVDKIVNRGIQQGLQEGRQEGRLSVLTELVEKGMLAIQQAAEVAGMDVASFELALESQ